MKRFLLLFTLVLAISTFATASTINCTAVSVGNEIGVGGGAFVFGGNTTTNPLSGVFSCPGIDAGAGNVVTSAFLTGDGDYAQGSGAGIVVTETWNISGSPFGTATINQTISGGVSSGSANPVNPFQLGATITPNTQTTLAFLINWGSAVTSGGGVGVSTAVAVLNYEIGPADNGGGGGNVPEPATIALVGLALVGIGRLHLLARSK